jgi:hypothetical protein
MHMQSFGARLIDLRDYYIVIVLTLDMFYGPENDTDEKKE